MVFLKNKYLSSTKRVACIVLAGGQGTRLFPLTSSRCKPAVRFGGSYRLIDIPISNSLNAQINNIFIISQYFSSGLVQHIKDTYSFHPSQGGTLTLLGPEKRLEGGDIWYRGTADAVRKNLNYLTEIPVDYFLILSGDQLYNMDLDAMVRFAQEKDADLTVGALAVPQSKASRLGLLNIDDTGRIIDFYEKPQDLETLEHFQLSDAFIKAQQIRNISCPCFLASMGIYVFKKEVLIELLRADTREDFGKHLIPSQLKRGRASAFLYQGYWEDIGTIASFYQANLTLTDQDIGLDFYSECFPIYTQSHPLPGAHISQSQIVNSIICNGSIIKAKEIFNSVVGIRSVVGLGTIIRDSILLGNAKYKSHAQAKTAPFHIGNHCTISKTIIDENVIIGNHVQLINKKKLRQYDGNGIFIRDNVIIVASNAHIPDHFVL